MNPVAGSSISLASTDDVYITLTEWDNQLVVEFTDDSSDFSNT